MNDKEKQLVFETAVKALHKQNKKSTDGTVCLYRGPNGIKCAIGHMLSDEDFNKFGECSIGKLVSTQLHCGDIAVDVHEEDVAFLEQLQWMHDKMKDSGDFRERLDRSARSFAEYHKLVMPSMD